MKRRLFVGLPIPGYIKNHIVACIESFPSGESIRLVPKENYHITVCFLGTIHEEYISELSQALGDMMKKISHFVLEPRETPIRRATDSLVWIEFKRNKEFDSLVEMTRRTVSRIVPDLKVMKKPQIPHITVARIHRDVRLFPHIDAKDCSPLQVLESRLYESHLKSGGVHYSTLASWKLGTA